MNTARSQRVDTACTRVVQKAVVARNHPPRKLSAAANSTLGTKSRRCIGVVRNRASNVTMTTPRISSNGIIVVIFQTRFSTTA